MDATEGPDPPGNFNSQFREAMKDAQHIIVLAGAGLSAASGIPTFRDGGGMWRSLDATSLATPEAFSTNPSLVWQFYHYRRTRALAARPNPAHETIAKLLIPTYLKEVAPNAKSLHLITQNIDGLSSMALESALEKLRAVDARTNEVSTPKTSIVEMHGRLFDVKCTECGFCRQDRSPTLCPALSLADDAFQNYEDAGTKEINIPESDLPRCTQCGALARPGVVWFGEMPHHMDKINQLVFKADMILVVGTSSTVRPASTFTLRVQRRRGKVAVFNTEPSRQDDKADFLFIGRCETVLPDLFPELND
ncbi:DHS-like NAD/FAD-binding domain-containing protein [Phlebopus sp. FC_14]|nr:DHS-like NAD/FAD-binding domain-containing protein [Phlebopus sp. FC_14]